VYSERISNPKREGKNGNSILQEVSRQAFNFLLRGQEREETPGHDLWQSLDLVAARGRLVHRGAVFKKRTEAKSERAASGVSSKTIGEAKKEGGRKE
jgi:hypothetical protein